MRLPRFMVRGSTEDCLFQLNRRRKQPRKNYVILLDFTPWMYQPKRERRDRSRNF